MKRKLLLQFFLLSYQGLWADLINTPRISTTNFHAKDQGAGKIIALVSLQ